MPPRFGTSGVRGLVLELTDRECYCFARAFLEYAQRLGSERKVGLSGDLRTSTPRILEAVAAGARDSGFSVVYCGRIPTPALCLFGMGQSIPTIMVTGSHIPDDRNGIKFNLASGEILKHDEAGILAEYDRLKVAGAALARFSPEGAWLHPVDALPPEDSQAAVEYRNRFASFFPAKALAGCRIGVYQHSAVGRDLLQLILLELGAEALPLARSQSFIAVDTEAVSNPEELSQWVSQWKLDALVGTDGDSDRPLVVDDEGALIHGDLLGMLTARYLRADSVVVPVSCNSGLETSGYFRRTLRTRIGSPFVIEGIGSLVDTAQGPVVGFEANGGFLVGTPVSSAFGGFPLAALPTRDAVLPILAVLHLAVSQGRKLSDLRRELPQRFTVSGLIRHFPSETGHRLIELIREKGLDWFARETGEAAPEPREVDFTDGARIRLADNSIVHLRPSGNAPEFRCYTEAETRERALVLNEAMLPVIAGPLRDEAEKCPAHPAV